MIGRHISRVHRECELLDSKRILAVLLRARRSYLRSLTTSSASHAKASPRVSASAATTPAAPSSILRKVFDDPAFFSDFNEGKQDKPSKSIGSYFTASSSPGRGSSGLFCNEFLTSPQGLIQFSLSSLEVANGLVQKLIEPNQSHATRLLFIKKIDELSDILCRVIDVAEFIRVVHPSGKWVQAAQQTHEMMFEFMNKLNTNVELYQNLVNILNDPEITQRLTDEELKVGDYLVKDFERSGIDLDDKMRENFVNITQEISLIGSNFNNGTQALDSYWCQISNDEYESISPAIKSQIKKYLLKSGRPLTSDTYVPLAGEIPYRILTSTSNESLRKKIWISLHSSTEDQLHLLNGFLKYRSYLAAMLGYKSFSSYQLEHKMAKNPENVMTFLGNLQTSLLKGGVMREIKQLYEAKTQEEPETSTSNNSILASIKPWDRDYLLSKVQARQDEQTVSSSYLSDYFSVGTIISGLDQLFTSIYNISLIPESTKKGETWDNNNVRKLRVFDNTNKHTLGFLYLDFWSSKVLPSHFTIACSRQLHSEPEEDPSMPLARQVHLDESGQFQLPVISLVCNFSNHHTSSIFGGRSSTPTLLTLEQVDTIFHEMGHAMHSMIGRTKLHNLAGTRCSTDFVELPSVLMEFFSKDPRVMHRIAKHYETGEALPIEKIEQYQKQRIQLDDCETYIQSKMAMLDQVLHSESMIQFVANGEEIDSTAIYHDLESKLKVFADEWSTWHGKFPHLFSYGAVYYSYLLDRAIADKVWTGLFETDPWSREAGEKYKQSILKWGGTRDPWECLADALGDEELRKGDERAMEIIGRRITN